MAAEGSAGGAVERVERRSTRSSRARRRPSLRVATRADRHAGDRLEPVSVPRGARDGWRMDLWAHPTVA